MTIVAALSIAGAFVGVFGGLFAWVVNRTIFSRLDALETARGAQAERFGEGIGALREQLAEVRGHLREVAAVERYKAGRWP